MLEHKITRNLPIKVICPNTRHRIINQVIYEEYIWGIWNNKSNWTEASRKRLQKYGIDLKDSVLKSYKLQLKKGERDPISAPSFKGDLFSGNYASRYGKDGMYKQFELWATIFAEPGKNYVGLPANQILSVVRSFNPENVYACESDATMARFMLSLLRHFSNPPHATIIDKDIFEFLLATKNRFSIFDFDLMCQINSDGLIEKLSNCIYRTMENKAVVNIATTVGRWISDEEYKKIMPAALIKNLQKLGANITQLYSGGYNDRIIPMRYEFLALEK